MQHFRIKMTCEQERRSRAWNTAMAVAAVAVTLEGLGRAREASATRYLALHLTRDAMQYASSARAARVSSEAAEWAALIG
jgi:hypothetical protein